MRNTNGCRHLCMILLLPACLVLNGQAETTAWWNQFRGPNSTGLAPEGSQPPFTFSADQNLLWKTRLDEGSSSPVIWENHLYLTAFNKKDSILIVMCLDRKDGSILWSDSISPDKIEDSHAISNPAQSTPFADQYGVYVYFASCGIKCYGHDGSLRWEKIMPCIEKKWGNPVSLLVTDGKVILNQDFRGKKFRSLLALDKHNGEQVWNTLTFDEPPLKHNGYPGYSTPVRFGDQIIVHKCGGVAAFSLEDGKALWWFPLVTNGTSTPLVYKGQIFVTTWVELSTDNRGDYFDYTSFQSFLDEYDSDGDGLICKMEFPEDVMIIVRPELDLSDEGQHTLIKFRGRMDKDKNDTINENEWIQFAEFISPYVEDVGLVAIVPEKTGELSMDDVLWNETSKAPEVPGPVACDEYVYMIENGGWLTCMDKHNGRIFYQERLGSSGAAIASPVIANGHLYLASHNGRVRVIPAGKDPEVLHECKLPGKITATPAIQGKSLYIRTSEAMYAFSD